MSVFAQRPGGRPGSGLVAEEAAAGLPGVGGEPIAAVLAGLERRSAGIGGAMASAARERVPEIGRVAALDAEFPRLEVICAAHVKVFVRSARSGRPPGAADLEFVRELGTCRSRDLFPLEALMHGVRAGQQVLWNEIVAEAGPAADGRSAALALTAHLIDYTDRVGQVLEHSYVAAQAQLAAGSALAREAFLEDVLSGRLFTRPEGARRAFAAGFEADADYLVAAVGVQPAAPLEVTDSLHAACERLALPGRRPLLVARRGAHTVVVAASARLADVHQLLASVASAMKAANGCSTVAGVGGPCRGVSQLPQACEAALFALRCARRAGGVVIFDDLGVIEYLTVSADPTARGLARRLSDPLAAEQERRGNALIRTFSTYLDCDMNVVRTAATLGLHPNTIRHRLDRIDSLTGLDTRRVRDVMELATAIGLCAAT